MKITAGIAINLFVCWALGSAVMTGGPRSLAAQEGVGERFPSTPPATPTMVAIDLWGVQILGIKPETETYEVEAIIAAMWTDTRLARSHLTLYQDKGAEDILAKIWWPYFEIKNSRGPRTTIHRIVRIDVDGKVQYQERFIATIKQSWDLWSFPFDDTDIDFTVVPFYASGGEVHFARMDSADVPRRRVSEVEAPKEWSVYDQGMDIKPDSSGLASATVWMKTSRFSDNYIFNIILPLALIVLASSAVFWMDHSNSHLGDRLGVSFTALLTVVAFDFVTSEGLPKLFYLTIMDTILIGTYVIMALVMVQNVWACVLHSRNKPTIALRVDRVSRVLFPVGYLVFLSVLYLTA